MAAPIFPTWFCLLAQQRLLLNFVSAAHTDMCTDHHLLHSMT